MAIKNVLDQNVFVSDTQKLKNVLDQNIFVSDSKKLKNVLDQNVFVSDTQKIPLVTLNVRLPWTKGRRRRRAGRRRRNLRRKTPEPQNRKFNQEESTSIHEPEPKSRG
jgi:hypothetical protein